MILIPIVSAAEEIEQIAPPETEQSVSSDSQNQDSSIATEDTENKTKSVDENPGKEPEAKNQEDENKDPEEEPENKTADGDINPPDDMESKISNAAVENALAKLTKPNKFKPRGKLASDLFTGAANYTYTIESPPGRNGLQPSVSLSYSSSGVKGVAGIVGVGWNLNLSYVQRNVNYTYRDTEIADDKFELYLFGSKIDLVPDNPANLTGRYRGENQPSIYVEANDNNSDNKIDQWTVKQPDGTKLFFGVVGSEDCRITNNFQNRDYTSRWYLKKIQDTQQTPNEIYYNYLITISNSTTNLEGGSSPKKDCGQLYLASIKYNNEQNREILFKYEARPDIIPQFQQGLWVQQCYRLHSIETKVKVDGTLTRVNNWQMQYVEDLRSYLEKIHEAPTDAKKFTTSFGYKRGWPELANPDNNLKIFRIAKHKHIYSAYRDGGGSIEKIMGKSAGCSCNPYTRKHDYHAGISSPRGFSKIGRDYDCNNHSRINPSCPVSDSEYDTFFAFFKQMNFNFDTLENNFFDNKKVVVGTSEYDVLSLIQSGEKHINIKDTKEALFAGKYLDIDGDSTIDLVVSCN